MGRRRLWIIVGTVLALVVVVLSLALLRPIEPFRFLEGQVPWSPPPKTTQMTEVYYSWQEANVLGKARTELLSKGFEEMAEGMFDKGRTPELGLVIVFENTRVMRDTLRPISAKGWVTVVVQTPGEARGLWNRIKAVFGL